MDKLQGLKILFVDDRFEIAKIQIKAVRAQGASVHHDSRLLDALESLDGDSYDLAIIDLHLPIELNNVPSKYDKSMNAVIMSESENVRSHNGGQIIGHHINEIHRKKPRFIYMSAVSQFYEAIESASPFGKDICHDRGRTSIADLISILVNLANA